MENVLWGSLKNQVRKVMTFDILILYMQVFKAIPLKRFEARYTRLWKYVLCVHGPKHQVTFTYTKPNIILVDKLIC